ncbi:type II toxin-antitoxin system VapC family toxin [Thalassospira australica]|uniref:type II toxin-antitoxin system VapC family toxin n=1 Tax=Thalassospira australica TaxID=1528106 RepID=UPI00384D6810
MTTLLDTNILIAMLDDNNYFHRWALEKFDELKTEGPMLISDIVYCEASVGMESQEAMDTAIYRLGIDRIPSSNKSLFRAGRAFKRYKQENHGPKLGVLPDYTIGAIAETEGIPLLTTNPSDYVGYFPEIEIIKPTPTAP